jgi:hypothetical protein
MPKLYLKKLTSNLIQEFLPTAILHRNLLINDVPDNLFVEEDQVLATSVISGLIRNILSATENNCIRLSARIFEGIIFLNITDGKNNNHCGIIEGYQTKLVSGYFFNSSNLAA